MTLDPTAQAPSDTVAPTPPNPGSDEALAQGCRCPVLDNNHGLHAPWHGDWWVRSDCPLHGFEPS
jgi:hypothetical protein